MLKSNKYIYLHLRKYIDTSFLNKNIKSLTFIEEITNKKELIIDLVNIDALEKSVAVIKATEEKFKKEGMHNIEINVSLSLGPISVSITKKMDE